MFTNPVSFMVIPRSHEVQASPAESDASQLTIPADPYGQGLLSGKEFQDATAKKFSETSASVPHKIPLLGP